MTTDTVSDLSNADTGGQLDAAEYKHLVLGLLFLKYIFDSFQSRRDELKAELTKLATLPDYLLPRLRRGRSNFVNSKETP